MSPRNSATDLARTCTLHHNGRLASLNQYCTVTKIRNRRSLNCWSQAKHGLVIICTCMLVGCSCFLAGRAASAVGTMMGSRGWCCHACSPASLVYVAGGRMLVPHGHGPLGSLNEATSGRSASQLVKGRQVDRWGPVRRPPERGRRRVQHVPVVSFHSD